MVLGIVAVFVQILKEGGSRFDRSTCLHESGARYIATLIVAKCYKTISKLFGFTLH